MVVISFCFIFDCIGMQVLRYLLHFRRFSDVAPAERVVSPSVHSVQLQSMMGIQSLLTAISLIAVKINSNLRYRKFLNVPNCERVAWPSGLWRWF